MRLLLSTALLLITSVVAPTFARPNSPVVCDLNSGVSPHTRSGNTVNTVASASVTTLTPGGTSTISLQNQNGGFTGFLVYVTDGSGAHAGKMTSTGQATTLSSPCNNNVPTGTTFGHNSQTAKTQLSWTWTAPATPNPPYTIMALVAEAQGVPPLVQVAPVTLNVQAAQPATQPPTQPPVVVVATQAPPVATQAPATNTNPNPTPAPATNSPTTPATTTTAAPTPTVAVVATAAPTTATATTAPTIQQLLNTVLVKLQAVLNGTGAVADLKSAIQTLIKQLQTAIQKAKTAKKSANANKPVNVVVSKATSTTGLATAAAGSSAYSIQLGFVEMEDAQAFRDSMVQAASTNSTIHAQSALNDGSLTSGLYYDPAGLDAQGNLQISAATVALYTCPDGTQVSQDMVAVMCPTSTMQAGAPGTTSSSTNPVSDTMFIGIVIGGVAALLLVVAGFVYYQKSKATTTVAPRV